MFISLQEVRGKKYSYISFRLIHSVVVMESYTYDIVVNTLSYYFLMYIPNISLAFLVK